MGVTIHFQGRIKSASDYDKVISLGEDFARRINSEVIVLDNDNKLLHRVKDKKAWEYEGPVRGIQIQPDENSDPLILEFDEDLYIQQFCKTQFAGIAVHIDVIQFLRFIEPYFEDLVVVDEGDFWDTLDVKILERRFEDFFDAFDEAIKKNPNLKGPFRMPDGRIIDLME